MVTEQWKVKFLEAMRRSSRSQEMEFLALVDQVASSCSIDVARVLMKSFSSRADYGTQERVVSVLASANRRDAITALLEELPRLILEAPDWAEDLVGQEIDRCHELLMELARGSSQEIVNSLRKLLTKEDFLDLHPKAKLLCDLPDFGIETSSHGTANPVARPPSAP